MARPLSTSALAKSRGISGKELFSQLEARAFIKRTDDGWQLLPGGERAGGAYASHAKYGRYITWPEDLQIHSCDQPQKSLNQSGSDPDSYSKAAGAMLTASSIGRPFQLPASRINAILSELGWIEKALKGWNLTRFGSGLGGVQKEDARSGIPYVIWPETIISNRSLKGTIRELQGESPSKIMAIPSESNQNHREKFETRLRTTDGHYVHSSEEMQIDNWLYLAEIVHACERRLPIQEEVYCDFYLPAARVYIEFWRSDSSPEYQQQKTKKQRVYEQNGFKLIELTEDDIRNLDEVLPRLLLKHGLDCF